MSNLQNNIQRIKTASEDIADAIELKGIDVPECAGIEDYAELISQIPTGGTGGSVVEWIPSKNSGDPIGTLKINGVSNTLYSNFPGSGGSGSTVEWNQIQGSSNATKIAEITINGTKKNVYSPNNTGGGGSITVDSELSNTSTNPVQNKAITNRIAQLISDIQNNYATKTYVNNQINQISIESGLTEQQVRNIIASYCLFKVKYSVNDTPQCVTSESIIDLSGIQGPIGPIGPIGRGISSIEHWYKKAPVSQIPTAVGINNNPEDAGWNTDTRTINLDETDNGLFMFYRYTYTSPDSYGNTIWDSPIVCIRYYNQQANIDYDELADIVSSQILSDLEDAKDRLDNAESILDALGIGHTFTNDSDIQEGLIDFLLGYNEGTQQSFTHLIVDAEKSLIENTAASKIANELGETELVSVKNTLDGIKGVIGNFADYEDTQGNITTVKSLLDAKNGEIAQAITGQSGATLSDARQLLRKDMLAMAVTKGQAVWINKTTGEYEPYEPGENETIEDYEERMRISHNLSTIIDEMSQIQMEPGLISLLVGDGGDKPFDKNGHYRAGIIIDAINDDNVSEIKIDADKINLTGETICTILSADSIFSNYINSEVIDADYVRSLVGEFGGLTIGTDENAKIFINSDVGIKSSNYPGTTNNPAGFWLNFDGSAVFNDVTVRGELYGIDGSPAVLGGDITRIVVGQPQGDGHIGTLYIVF